MKTQLRVLPFAFLAVCVSDVMNKASTCGKSINHVQLSSWHNKNWQTVTHLQKGLPSDSSHTSVARSHVPSAISTSHGLLSPLTGENKSCHAMQYYTCPYCHQNITWPAVPRHWENKPCHVMPHYTCPYCHQNITWSAVACHWGKQVMPCHIMPCHTIHVLIAIRMSHGLLLSVTEGSKSCDNRLHHTIPYNTAISTSHSLLSPLIGGSKSCHVSPYNTIQHCNQHATWFAVDSLWGNKVTPHTYHISYHITPYYSILHHIHHFTLYHTIHHATLYNIHYTTHTLYIYIIPYVYNTTHHTAS